MRVLLQCAFFPRIIRAILPQIISNIFIIHVILNLNLTSKSFFSSSVSEGAPLTSKSQTPNINLYLTLRNVTFGN